MSCTEIVKARVTSETKQKIAEAALRESLSEASWLKRVLARETKAAGDVVSTGNLPRRSNPARSARSGAHGALRPVLVRLRPDDRLLLEVRAEARGMRSATYLSVLARGHLRRLAPLPRDELLAFERTISALAAIGRNLNQIARSANDGGQVPASVREDLRLLLKVSEAMRLHVKALLKANVTSWESGYDQTV